MTLAAHWRHTVLPRWRRVRAPLIIVLGLVVLVLGTIGYQRAGAAAGVQSLIDAFFHAVKLFGLGGDTAPNWEIEVARDIAPMLAGYAAVAGLVRLLREQFDLSIARMLMRDHTIVAGLGETGARLATAFREAGHDVVALERDITNPNVASVRERGVIVLFGSASDPELLSNTRPDRARNVIITCGTDGANLDVARVAQDLAQGRRGTLTALVQLEDLDLWRILKAESVSRLESPGFRVEFFSVHASTASTLLDRHPPLEAEHPHPCVIGLKGIGENVVLGIAGLWRSRRPDPGARLPLTVAGPTAQADVQRLLERHPEIARLCDLRVRPAEIGSAAFQRGDGLLDDDGRSSLTQVYVLLEDDSQALAAAAALHKRPDMFDLPVVVVVLDDEAGIARLLQSTSGPLAHAQAFGVMSAALTPQLALQSSTEFIARAKHGDYVTSERALGHTVQDNPSMAPWEDLPDSLRDSNRRFADGIGRKLDQAGLSIVPAPLIDPDGPLPRLGDDDVEALARQEHDRWMNDLLRDGWRPTSGAKDALAKLHPMLIPWQELDEAERDKDRQPVLDLPRMLARAGYELYRTRA